MTAAQITVTMLGALLIVGIVWFFWLKKAVGTPAVLSSSGYQEATILVKDGVYTPDTILVDHGTPVRLTFRREEAVPCSETVLFDSFGKSARLPQGQPVSIELMPDTPGRYGFACQMGMYRGTLVVQ
jgi:plastocyanin domain-containing protein